MTKLTKSKFIKLWQCPKLYYLSCKKPELSSIDDSQIKRMETGNNVGDFAMGLFGDYVEVTVKNSDKLDIGAMLTRTKEEVAKGTNVICEAAFDYDGCYCAVDILKKEKNGYAIYEVKSSTKVKDYYLVDVAYQKYVLEHCGINIVGTYVVVINNEYVRHGDIEINKLFKIVDVSNDIDDAYNQVPDLIKKADKIYNLPEEPIQDLSIVCDKPGSCEFWDYCAKDIPYPSIFDIYKLPLDTKYELYNRGIITYNDIVSNKIDLSEIRQRQVDYYLNDKGMYVDKNAIKDFLNMLSFPLYFLDFETIMPVIPEYDDTRPYQQVPFQYSLHYIEKEGGELKHKEFLADPKRNPLRDIAESLCENIPMNVCVTAYYKAFECTRLEELASMFPDLSKHLLNIKENVIDFLIPFQSGMLYNKEMCGTFSIKSVLPALFPNDPTLDYHNLKGIVHNGGEAMDIFPQMKYMNETDYNNARESLLRYCELDTYAMVKVWEKLKEVVK